MIKVSIITIAKEIKEIHPEYIALIKCGNFYKVYGKDACIVANLFKYTIKEEQGLITCGFPINSIKKIETQLESKKVNYIVIDRRDNYSVGEKVEFRNLNSYEKEYEKAKTYVKNSRRIEAINQYLQDNINYEWLKNVLKDIESVINAKR